MASDKSGSKTDVIVKLVLVFFIALLSFSIGTFVGKKFSDNQHKLATLESDPSLHGEDATHEDRGIASVPPDANEVKPNQALSDQEIAKLAEEFVSDDGMPKIEGIENKPADDEEEKTVEHDAPKKEDVTAAKIASQEEKAHVPDVAKAELVKKEDKITEVAKSDALPKTKKATAKNESDEANRLPSSLPKDLANTSFGKFTVQVAAYPSEKEAQTMAASLKDKGFSAFYIPAKVKGETWYRVSVGLFTTEKEAKTYKSELVTKAKVPSAIVQKVKTE